MKEKLITFETAKLAKEKGFNIKLKKRFRLENGVAVKKKYGKKQDFNTNNPNHEVYSRPTQSLLQKWLREVHKISVEVSSSWWDKGKCEWKYNVYKEELGDDSPCSLTVFKSYEEALEIGIQEGLKLIKNGC
jgi:hypothetical protein